MLNWYIFEMTFNWPETDLFSSVNALFMRYKKTEHFLNLEEIL